MSDSLFLEERRRAILAKLNADGRVSVRDLSEEMAVSAVTIRQDLRALEETGLLQRTRGGAVLPEHTLSSLELSFEIRRRRADAEKDALGQAAAALVRDGYGVALDASTTAFAVVPYLKKYDGLTVVTNSIIIAQQFLDTPRIQVMLPAGRLRRDSVSVVGGARTLPDINLNVGFFSAYGFAVAEGATEISVDEVEMKRALLTNSLECILLIDGSKWGRIAPYTYAQPADFSRVLTTASAPMDLVERCRAGHVSVDVVT